MMRVSWFGLIVGVWLGLGTGEVAPAAEPGEKAARYHRLLLKRPDSKIVYERFFDAWLDEGDKDGLEEFLVSEAKDGGAAENWILGVYHQQAGRDAEALQVLDQAVAQDPENGGLRMARAQVRARLLQFQEAIEDLDKALASDAGQAVEAGKLKGAYLARAGRPDEAVEAWQALLKNNPDDDELAEDLIDLLIGEGLFDEALAAAQTLAEGTRDAYQKALRRLRVGEIQRMHGKRDEAVETYTEVLRSTGQGTWLEREVLAQIDELFKREDDFEGLRAFYEKTSENQPQRTELQKALAQLTAQDGKVDEAVDMMRELMRLSPRDRQLRVDLVDLLAQYEREEDAAAELEVLLESEKNNALLWERLAELRQRTGELEKVKAALAEVDRLAGDGEEARLRVARLYERFEMMEVAEKLLREAAEGGAVEAKEALASFLMDRGEKEAALAQWREMAANADLDGLMRVVRSLQARGKVEEAYELMVARRDEFGRDPVSLAMFCQVAQMADHAEEALPEARRLVRLADQPTEIRDAIAVTSRLVMRAKQETAVLDEIAAAANPSVNDLCLAADLWEVLGDSRAADRMLARAEEAGGGLLALTQRVQLLERRGDFAGAAEAMNKIVNSEVGRRPIYRKRLVELLRRAGNLKEALAQIERRKEATPGDQQAWLAEAEVHSEAGEFERAVVTLRRAQARFGREEAISVPLANAHLEVGEGRAARAIFERLYEDAEQNADKVRWAARLAEVAEEDDSAEQLIAQFERRKRNNPKSVTPLLALAEIYHTLDLYEERRETLAEAIRRRPADLNLRFNLARVEERAGDLERAVETLKAARQHDETGATQHHLARLLLRYGETDQALNLLKDGADEQQDPRAIENLAEVMAIENEWQAALDYLAPFVARFADDWRLRYLLAVCAEEEGQVEQAIDHYLQVSEADAPLPGVKPILPRKDRVTWNKFGQAELPPRAQRLNLVFFYQRHAYSYRNSSQRYGSPVLAFPLPGDEEEARALALCHLLGIVREQPEAEQEQLLARLQAAGHEDADLLVNFGAPQNDSDKFVEVLTSKLEAEPDDKALLLLALASPSTGDVSIPTKWKLAARDVLQDEMPLVALIANVDLLLSEEEGIRAGALEAIPSTLSRMKDDDLGAGLNAVAGLLSAANREQFGLSDDERSDLFDTLLGGFRRSEITPPHWSVLVGNLIAYAVERDRYDVVVEVCNKVCGNPPAQLTLPAVRPRPYYYGALYAQIQARSYQLLRSAQQRVYYGSQSSEVVELVPFPPTGLRTVPDQLVALLNVAPEVSGDERLSAFLRKHSASQSSLEAEKLAAQLEEISDPAFRLFVLAAAEDEEALADAVAAVEEKDDPQVDELRFAAGFYAARKDDELKALQLLAKARRQPMERTQAADLDRVLLLLGARLVEQDELPEELAEVPKRAGLRARRTRGLGVPRSGNARRQQQQIDAALATLGVESSRRPVARRALARRSTGSRNQAGEEVGRLLRQGNRQAAVRTAARDLQRYHRFASNQRSSSQGNEIIKVVQGLGLSGAVLDRLDPGPDAGVLRLERFAEICRLLDESERAKPVLEQILERDPENKKAKVMMIAYLPAEDRSAALAGITLDSESFEVLQELFGQRGSSYSADFDETINLVKTFTAMLNAAEPDGKDARNLTFINYRVVNLLRVYRFGGTQVRRLNQAKEGDEEEPAETAQWHAAFAEVCRAMLRHPQTAAQGFMLLHHTCEARSEQIEDLEDEALVALKAYARFDPPAGGRTRYYFSNRWALVRSNGSSSSSSVPSDVPAPAEYLLAQAAEQDRPELLDAEIIADVRPHDPALAKRMEAYREVLFNEGEKRIAAFESLREAIAEPGRQPSSDVANAIRLLMEHAGDDEEFISHVGEAVLEQCKPDANGQIPNSTLVYSVLPAYGKALMEREGGEAYRKFLITISQQFLGPQEEWDVLIKAVKLRRTGSFYYAARNHSRMMEQLVSRPEVGMPTAVHLVLNDLHQLGVSNLVHYLQQSVRQQKFEEAGDVEQFFAEGGFLADAAGFDPLSLGGVEDPFGSSGSGSSSTVLGSLCDGARSSNELLKKTGAEWMKAEGENRFAKRLIGAALTGETGDEVLEVVRGELERNKEKLEAMPPAQRAALASFLVRWFGQRLEDNKFPVPLESWRLTVSEGGREQVREDIEEWLAHGFGRPGDYESRERAQGAILLAMRDEPELAARLFARYAKDVRAAVRAGSWSSSSTSNGFRIKPWDNQLNQFSYHFRRNVLDPQTLVRFLGELLDQPEAAFMSFEYGLMHATSSQISKTTQKIIAENDGLQKENPENLQPALWPLVWRALVKDLPKEAHGVAAAGLASFVAWDWGVNASEPPTIEEATKGLETESPLLAAAVRFGLAIKRRGSTGTAGNPTGGAIGATAFIHPGAVHPNPAPAGQAHPSSPVAGPEALAPEDKPVVSFLRRDDIPNELKYELLGRMNWTPGPALTNAIAEVLTVHANGERNVLTSSMANLLDRLTAGKSADREIVGKLHGMLAAEVERNQVTLPQSGADKLERILIELALRAGKTEELAKKFRGRDNPYEGDTKLLLKLLQEGEAELAVQLVPGEDGFYDGPMQPFTRQTEEHLAQFLPLIESERARYRTEVMIARSPDAEGEDAPEEERSARLARLTGLFSERTQPGSALRLQVLSAFAKAGATLSAEMVQEIQQETAEVLLAHHIVLRGTSFAGGDAEERRETALRESLVPLAVRFAVERGDTQPAERQIDALANPLGNPNTRSEASRTFTFLIREIVQGAVSGLTRDEPVNAESYLGLARAILEIGLAPRNSDQMSAAASIALAVIVHALAEKGENYDSFLEGLGEDAKQTHERMREQVGLRGLFSFLATHAPWLSDENREARRVVVRAILLDEATCEREIKHMTDLTVLIDSNAFTQDDVLAIISELPDDHPRRAEFLLEEAGIMGWRVKDDEKAQELYALARKLAAERGDDALASQSRAYHARYTAQVLADHPKALEIARGVDPSLLVEQDRKWYESESENWKKAAENNEHKEE